MSRRGEASKPSPGAPASASAEDGLWELRFGEGAGDASLTSLNGFCGRQTWAWVPGAGTPGDRAAVAAARSAYNSSRHSRRHAGDALLRLQAARTRAARGLPAPPPLPPASALPPDAPLPVAHVTAALRSGLGFFQTLQAADGHWAGDYGGPMFLLPGLVAACHVTGSLDAVLPPVARREVVRYLGNHQNEDGGFGLHVEGGSTMFGTAMSYVTLRLLGEPAEGAVCAAARGWIRSHGGATAVPSWGKFWLAVLGVYDWCALDGSS